MQTPKRLAIIDVLRGWALLVVVISNYLYYAYSPEGEINGKGFWSSLIQIVESYFFSAKGWTLLFVLFGYGFGVLYTRMQHKTYAFLTRRLLVLLVFAFFNSLLFDGDILRDYAILGLLFLFFLHFSVRKLVITIAAFVLIIPFLAAKINSIDNSYVTALSNSIAPLRFSHHWFDVLQYNFLSSYYFEVLNLHYSVTVHWVMFTCMLIGLALQKSHFFENLQDKKSLFRKIMISSLVLTLVLWAILILSSSLQWSYLKYFASNYWIVLTTMLFTASGIVVLYSHQKCQFVFNAFSWVGKMTFTNYLVQNILNLLVFQGVGLRLFHHMPLYFYFVLAIIVYVLQILFSYWWLQSHSYGPFEWLWRKCSGTWKTSNTLVMLPIAAKNKKLEA
ncbi:DUF418 domain-containing protein [Flavobacterium sp. GCM10027622]|uniref:DUF418 domain-containing protein n=1 Tax=unclassified Flavobacterium TaxID=196869 RepID=UPI003611EC6C